MIIAISGKIGSGKDSVGIIIQGLNASLDFDVIYHHVQNNIPFDRSSGWEIKKFANKLKDIVCLLIGCTREQLEDRKFKDTELGEEWWRFQLKDGTYTNYLDPQREGTTIPVIKMTPRKLLQLLGTDCSRNIIHPNIWVNSLMAEYKGVLATILHKDCPVNKTGAKRYDFEITEEAEVAYSHVGMLYPNWIITDVRFPNELKAIKAKNGISIKLTRPLIESNIAKYHESETALDHAKFDWYVDNSGNIQDLISIVKHILITEGIL